MNGVKVAPQRRGSHWLRKSLRFHFLLELVTRAWHERIGSRNRCLQHSNGPAGFGERQIGAQILTPHIYAR
jgi:hypothetical protein